MINDIFTEKQIKALKSTAKILVLHGAKRTGKTYILIIKFLQLVSSMKNKGRKFIIGGASKATIQANILDDMGAIIGKDIKLSQDNTFKLFGNKILVRAGANSDSWKGVRGFTAYGALLNEGTALHDKFIKEAISRCSGEGSEIYIDTNPENPAHPVKKDYIDKTGDKLESGRLNIEAIHFRLDDNTFLDKEYVEFIKKTTPSGMFYDRDIEGMWVSGEGVIYKDFDRKKHVISREEFNKKTIIKRWCGLDWGYEHFGSIVVLAEDTKGNIYLEQEIACQHKDIDFWVDRAKEIKSKYGNILFYCDTARPEYIARFSREGFNLGQTDKSVQAGIALVASYFKQDKFFIVEGAKRVLDELYMYVWNEKTGEPVKLWDDVLDSVRYAMYSTKKNMGDLNKIRSASYNYLNR